MSGQEKESNFEAAIQADGVLIRTDLLLPGANGMRMVEVKSTTSIKDYHLMDAAIQSWVAKQAMLPLNKVEIAYIDNSFIYPGDGMYQGLFHFADVSEQIADLQDDVPGWINAARASLSGGEPCVATGPQCHTPFKCPFLSFCSPSVESDDGFPPEILPYGAALSAKLRKEGYNDLRDVPADRLDNLRHQLVWRVSKSGQSELDPEAGRLLAALPYPRYYLDFETISLAVPVWTGTRPYMQVPFQWSCHIETAKGVMTHSEFLADGRGDPRQNFAESLIDAIGTNGPIFAYNAPFERSRMQELADHFPILSRALEDAIDRIVDLLPIAREYYYHPAMRGSWSIKAVLPTIAPDLAYDDLEVGNGDMAQQAFAEIMEIKTSPERRQKLKGALLSYCERDTLAMVRIAHYFEDNES
ncbi:MAG TPA: DUF2779 domain-containing protein [Gallionellaceae bacterium]|jgi:hypothetical protein|nr:MAG: hypothetical protein B7Y04_03775 [Gallionellales bacterium 24-53-125]OZB07578.1 MAG: hypothetical protein B7X61_13240 [Gallionellales bacterium 39-52-133]HQS58741.1 DUF2779 domain-containing protein [Gallionellaceae bacterium]HQS75081.1 DUF2779 domain-containing protein [Gallionellaceae bacterium]